MKTKTPIVRCGHCQGTGKIPLHRDMMQTLRRIKRERHPVIAAELMEEGIGHGAICNRLVKLESYGLIERAGKDGKNILWKISPPAPGEG